MTRASAALAVITRIGDHFWRSIPLRLAGPRHAACCAIREIDQGRRPTIQPERSERIDVIIDNVALNLLSRLKLTLCPRGRAADRFSSRVNLHIT
jgi:hypothetical protein